MHANASREGSDVVDASLDDASEARGMGHTCALLIWGVANANALQAYCGWAGEFVCIRVQILLVACRGMSKTSEQRGHVLCYQKKMQ
eukprot:9472004-Pyramimonas_sp.AAC.1